VRMQAKAEFSATPRSVLSKTVLRALVDGSNQVCEPSAKDRIVLRQVCALGQFASVAFQLCRVASASSPRSALSGAFAQSRRAAHVDKVSRIGLRLARKLKGGSVVSKSTLSAQLRTSVVALPKIGSDRPSVRTEWLSLPIPSGASRH
jgi:hypothetical protein